MNIERLLTILQAQHVSEKGTLVTGQYIFKVIKDATKIEIKQAIEHIFSVKVKAVRITNMKSKQKRFGKIMGRQKGWKKAYVTLLPGQEIDFT